MDLIMPITLNVDIELPKVERKTELACKLFHFFKFMAQSKEGLPFFLWSPHRTTFEKRIFNVAMLRYVSCFPSCREGFFNVE